MIYLGADHAGFELKEAVAEYLRYINTPFEDLGPKTMVPDDDYPIVAQSVAEKVSADPTSARGILFCGTGIGVCIVANKFDHVRAGIGYSLSVAESMRAHNDANVLCLAGRVLQPDFAKSIVKKFLATKFSGDPRHIRRLDTLSELE
jgi:ribose 5-phosphate isomerase B